MRKLAAMLWASVALACAPCVSAHEERAQVLQLEPYRKGLAARVEIAGQPRLMLFDTGGGLTILSPALAKAIGCEPTGEVTGFRMTGDKLVLPRCDDVHLTWSGLSLVVPRAPVFDLTPLVAKDADPIDGMIALDMFNGRIITLDSARGTLTVETDATAANRTAGMTEIPARLAREIGGRALAVYVDVPGTGGPFGFELDSGNGGTVLVDKANAKAFALDPDGGMQDVAITLAEGITVEAKGFTPDLTIDGNLGMPFLKDYVVTMELAKGRVWMRRNDVSAPIGMGAAPTPPPPPGN